MKTNKEIAENQIRLQEELQKAGFNVVECGNCGTTLIHKRGDEKIQCFCGDMNLSDCPDLWYEGVAENMEFYN